MQIVYRELTVFLIMSIRITYVLHAVDFRAGDNTNHQLVSSFDRCMKVLDEELAIYYYQGRHLNI